MKNPRTVGPLVSVIILNWNDGERIGLCLTHVFDQTYRPIEVIVVDNGSQDGSYECIGSEWGGQISLIHNEENRGYTGGMNQGIAAAQGEILLLLNSDVFLSETYVERAVQALERHVESQVGIVGGKLFFFRENRKTTLVNNPGLFLGRRMNVKNSRNIDQEEFVFGASGSCPVIRREVLDSIRLTDGQWFDESYFSQGEDIDLWFRAHLRGWKVMFVPSAVGWHVHAASYGGKVRFYERSDVFQVHAMKNRYMTILKNYPALLLVSMFPELVLSEVLIVIYLLLKSPRSLRNLLKAQSYILKNWSRIGKKRKEIQSTRKVSVNYLLSLYRGL